MSHEILVKTALKRQEAFRNLKKHLQTIKEQSKNLIQTQKSTYSDQLQRKNITTQAT